jgi:HK97 family phage portal protein
MGIFNRSKREEVMDETKCDDLLLKALLNGSDVDRNTALSIPVISGCVDLICNTFAMIPFKLYKETVKDGKRSTEEVVDNRVKLINEDTTDTLDGFQFKKAICEDYLMGQGGYAYIKKISNKFVGLFYVEESKITIQKNADAIFKRFDVMVDGNLYKNHEFLKLLRNTKDGASGKGLTEEISQAVQTASRRLRYEYELTATGGSRKGFLKSQKHLDEKALKALKKAWEEYYAGNANTVVLNDGIDFQEASNSSQQNEMNEKSRTFADEIREIFHLSGNYDDFIKNAIMPIATAFATALNRDFLLEKEKESYYFAPDTKELLKGSLRERYEAYRIAITTGFKTRNEVRYMEDDDALDGLDVISLGLGDVLLNTNDGTIYTPNTNTVAKMGVSGTQPANLAPNNEVSSEGI